MKNRETVKLKILLFILLTVNFLSYGQYNIEWLNSIGGNDSDFGHSMVVDSNDNVFIAGQFRGDVSFDPNSNNFDYTAGQYGDIYLQKLDNEGNFLWAKVFQSNDSSERPIISIDLNDNIYITSTFVDDIDLNPGINTDIHTSTGWGENTFIIKLNNNGEYIWGKSFENLSSNQIIEPSEMAIDNFGNILIAGEFQSTVDFDPSINSSTLTGGKGFLLKFDNDGNFLWVKQFTGSNGLNVNISFSSIVTDSQNNIIVGGAFGGFFQLDFDPGPSVFSLNPPANNNNRNLFVLKLDENGDFIWVKKAEGFSNNTNLHSGTDRVHSIVIDNNDDIIFSGAFKNNINFDLNSKLFVLDSGINGPSNSSGSRTGYLAKMSSSGNMLWAKKIEGSYARSAGNAIFYESDIILDFNENYDLFFGYGFYGILNYEIDGVPFSYSSNRNGWDMSLFQINPVNGDFISAHFIKPLDTSSTSFVYNNFLGKIVFKENSLFTCGTFSEGLLFDLTSSLETQEAGSDAFVAKFENVTSLSLEKLSRKRISVYPNPVHNTLNIKAKTLISNISIYDLNGRLLKSEHLNSNSLDYQIDVRQLSNGVYFLYIKAGNSKENIKFIRY